ncbi:septum formation initiator family protein [Phytoactinopolyspora mesophila]|uniref:Septum formation initiator family protein n=1 Tax=Phytoactinopolyspora mesophila TaxID=2650750 RepID=A0A7K3M7P0_9ACTN|nr:septum formation initiator family protein [Phytoactinopolyspora mesophila]NDL59200.1 septum formation initiator family protein [Phytoactinopolyspora mesophila]
MSAEKALTPPRIQRSPRRHNTLRVLPGTSRSPRAPFVVLVLLLLGVGLVGLLLLNTALQQGSFALARLEAETTALRDRAEMLASEVAVLESPAGLAERAEELGMVPGENLEFIELGTPSGGGGGE